MKEKSVEGIVHDFKVLSQYLLTERKCENPSQDCRFPRNVRTMDLLFYLMLFVFVRVG